MVDWTSMTTKTTAERLAELRRTEAHGKLCWVPLCLVPVLNEIRNGPSTLSQCINGSVFTSSHLLECLHTDIVLEALSFHSSCWDSKGLALTSFLRALQGWTRAWSLLYWDWGFWAFHPLFSIWVRAAGFMSLVCLSQVFWWCLPSLILGDLCTFLVTAIAVY